MKNKTAAKITGYSIIIMALLAAFAFGYAYPKICDLTDKSLTVTDLLPQNEWLKFSSSNKIIIPFFIFNSLYINVLFVYSRLLDVTL